MTSECLKLYFHALPKDFAESNDTTLGVVAEMGALHDTLSKVCASPKPGEEQDAELESFSQVLAAMHNIFLCAHRDEKQRPLASPVRASRKVVNDAGRDEGGHAAVAKSTMAYDAMKVAMQASRVHSVAGIEDQAATALFNQVFGQFETLFEVVFATGLSEWADPLSSDKAAASSFSLRGRTNELVELRGMMVAMHDAIKRWSSAALQEHMEEVADTLGNMLGVLGAASWT